MAFTDINSEDQLVEQPAIGLSAELDWTTVPPVSLRRTRDLLLPRLMSGQVNLVEFIIWLFRLQ